jgi:glycogen debranching enzyme
MAVLPSVAVVRLGTTCAWKGASLLVTTIGGECGPEDPLSGFYVREVRHLSLLRFEVNGERPWWCEWARPGPEELAFVFVHPELTRFGGGGSGVSGAAVTRDAHGIPHRALDIRLSYRVELHRLRARALVTNRSRESVSLDTSWVFAADYADLLEAQDGQRRQEAAVEREVRPGGLRLRYRHGRLPFQTVLTASGPGRHDVAPDRLTSRLQLASGEGASLELVVEAHDPDLPLDDGARAERMRAHDRWQRSMTRIAVPGNIVAEVVLARARDDLSAFPLLEGEPDEWLALQAGVPLYPAFFGRDALTAGWQAGMLDAGAMLDAALTRLGRQQATAEDEWRDAEPGRLLHSCRSGPLARLNLNPFAAYYGDFASPLMYVIALANLFAWTGDRRVVDRHWDTARRALEWARTRGDRDGDGYLEYLTRSKMGPQNQGWKDSGDAIVYEDGRPVPAPIATCEIQGYWYCAQQLMAGLAWIKGERAWAKQLWRSARELKRRFNRDYWMEDEGFYCLALDPGKRPLRVVTSNVGHCLACGIIERERLPAVVARLMSPDMFSGWGIRTLSSRHPSYNPLSYHLGSVWAVENATICFGLRRFGFDAEAARLAEALFGLAQTYAGGRIPETVGGYARGEHPTPGSYPRSNTPQAWNASALPLCIQTLLGLMPFASLHLLMVDPVLPAWLPDLELHGLRVGRTAATLRFWRDAHGHSHAEVVEKDGPLHLVRQPSPQATRAGLGRRLRALIGRTHVPAPPVTR